MAAWLESRELAPAAEASMSSPPRASPSAAHPGSKEVHTPGHSSNPGIEYSIIFPSSADLCFGGHGVQYKQDCYAMK